MNFWEEKPIIDQKGSFQDFCGQFVKIWFDMLDF